MAHLSQPARHLAMLVTRRMRQIGWGEAVEAAIRPADGAPVFDVIAPTARKRSQTRERSETVHLLTSCPPELLSADDGRGSVTDKRYLKATTAEAECEPDFG
jgi:hypothetical protein